jgi:hypothetical protein
MATYLRSQQQAKLLDESVTADTDAVRIAIVRYKIGSIDFNTYVTIAQNLVVQQNAAAQARGQIAQGLIAVYRALGGGWELKNEEESSGEPAAMETAPSRAEEEEAEQMPAPLPTVPEEPTAIKKPDAAKEPVPSKETDAAKKSDATEKSAEPKKPADEKSEPAVKEGTNALKIDNVLNEPSAES